MVRFGIVGCGAAARRIHMPRIRAAGFEVTAFASRTPASATTARDEWGGGDTVDAWRDLLTRDDVDAVCVCGPNSEHAQVAIAAAKAGKHVLVEKPMATSVADATAMIDAAAAAGVVLMPAQNLRMAKPFVAMAQAVARGDVGDLRAVRAAFGHGGPEGWAPASTWFRDPSVSGGGAVTDLGIHLIDLVHAITGQRITEVAAVLAGDGPVEEAGTMAIRLAGGAIGTLHASWVAPAGTDNQVTVHGSEGVLHLDSSTPPTLRRAGGGEPERVRASDPLPDLYQGFAAAVAGDGPPPVTGDDGRAAVAVVEAAYASARSGALVRLDINT